jgi:hypothetical protein
MRFIPPLSNKDQIPPAPKMKKLGNCWFEFSSLSEHHRKTYSGKRQGLRLFDFRRKIAKSGIKNQISNAHYLPGNL